MTSVTKASIAYIATQVSIYSLFLLSSIDDGQKARFALTSASTFSRTDTVTDSENFYISVLDLLEDPLETRESEKLLVWWNRCVGTILAVNLH